MVHTRLNVILECRKSEEAFEIISKILKIVCFSLRFSLYCSIVQWEYDDSTEYVSKPTFKSFI